MKSPKSEENAPYRRELGDGLALKTAASEEDVERKELKDSWPDLSMPPKEAYLMDILFSKMTSHIYTIY